MYFFITVSVFLYQLVLVLSKPIVTVEQGQIRGETIHFEDDFLNIQKDIDVFLGIPYAEPPVGDRRFEAPLPKAPWSADDIYNATYPRDICMQGPPIYDATMSEDCLHLNVYAPKPKVSLWCTRIIGLKHYTSV